MTNSSQSNQVQIDLQGQIALLDAQITLTNSGIDSKTEIGQTLRSIINANDLSSLRAKISDAEKYSKTLADDIGELEKWAKIASDVSKNPEETPFKLMNKALGKGFSNFSYEKEVISLEREINRWYNSLQDKNSKALATFLVGSEKPSLIAEAFPQFFNEFQYQGDQSKLIDIWYSRESWQGVSDAYYQEVAWRKSVLSEIQSKILLLNWQVATNSISPNQDLPNQPDINYLKDLQAKLEKQKANVREKLTSYGNFYQKYYQDFIQRGLLEEEAENLANEWAGAMIINQNDEAGPEAAAETQAYNAPDSQLRGFNPDTSHTGSRPISNRNQGPLKTREGQAFMERAEKNRGTYINPAVRGIRQIWGQIFRQSEQASQNRVQNAPDQAVGAATGIVGAVATTGIKAALNKGVQGLFAKAGAIAGPAGLLISQAASVIFDKEARQRFINFIKNTLTRAGLSLYVLYQYLASHILASATGVLGAFFLGPIGFIPGFAVGLGIESAFGIGGIGGTSGGILAGTGMTSSGTAVAAAGSSGGILAATWLSPAAAISVGGFGALFTAAFLVPSAFFQATITPVGQQGKAALTVEKTADKSFLPDYNGAQTTINYSLKISVASNDIKIDKITDQKTLQKDSGDIDKGTTEIPTSSLKVDSESNLVFDYSFDIAGEEFRDSTLLNTLTIEATDSKSNEKIIQKASFLVWINKKPVGQPYGFPAAGAVTSWDAHYGNTPLSEAVHWSCLFPLVGQLGDCSTVGSGAALIGGIDIAGPAGTPVQSTLDGKVIGVEYRPDVGGVVYLQNCANADCSELGNYIVEFEHLNQPEVTLNSVIKRGTQIGTTTTEENASVITGPHVHYQIILAGGGNVNFMDKSNAGKCSEGKIEPEVPTPGGQISPGPFVCN